MEPNLPSQCNDAIMQMFVSKMPTLAHNWANSVTIKNVTTLNIIQYIVNLCDTQDTQVVICIILVLLKRYSDLNHHLNIRLYTMALQRQNRDTIVNVEPKPNCQCHLSSSLRK